MHVGQPTLGRLNSAASCLNNRPHYKTSYDYKHPKGTKYTAKELRLHRDAWYEKMRNSPAVRSSYESRPADKALFEKLMTTLPWDPAMRFVQEHDFGGSFLRAALDPVRDYYDLRSDPAQQFLDADLEGLRADLTSKLGTFLELINANIFPVDETGNVCRLPVDWYDTVPERRRQVHRDMNRAANEVVTAYRALITECRQRLS